MTDYMMNYKDLGDKTPVDELDIIEAYVGEGPHEPRADDTFMFNLATGGCWPVDLSRYDGLADMYVHFVRVYK